MGLRLLLVGLLLNFPMLSARSVSEYKGNSIASPSKECALTKFFQHEGKLASKAVFLFSGNPVCTYIPREFDEEKIANGEPLKLVFFVPHAILKKESKPSIARLNNETCTQDYCIKVNHVTAPVKGIQFTVSYYPQFHGFEYQSFKSITGEEGVVFNFYNQNLLQQVNVKASTERIRRTAFADTVPTVILDFGHGGDDHGFTNGVLLEKEMNRQIGQRVAKLLKKKGYQVCLVREGDESLALDERTARIHACKDAGILISIHTNAAARAEASGIETFCHTSDMFTTHYQQADKNMIGTLQEIDSVVFDQSMQLAQAVHKNVLESAKIKNSSVVDRKVKHKVTQLLLASEMPSILVELGFLTNKQEAELLQKSSYQKDLAQGICKGIDAFFNMV